MKKTTKLKPSCFVKWMTLIAIALGNFCIAAKPSNFNNPPNQPRAIVKSMLERDQKALGRYTGWNEIEYQTLFESYPPYEIKRTQISKGGPWSEIEVVPTFGKCAQRLIVKTIKVVDVLRAPDPLSPAAQLRAVPNEVLVVVEAETLAIDLRSFNAIAESERCSWLGLQVQNTKTGKRESYFDSVDDDRALLKMMMQFGAQRGNYIVVEPHRRRWQYAISMRLPFTGKGMLRHYDKSGDLGTHKFVDAIEPRWLIQDPYPPEAWQIDTAMEYEARALKNIEKSAANHCRWAISEALGIERVKAKPNLEDPACKQYKSVIDDLAAAQVRAERVKILKDIKQDSEK